MGAFQLIATEVPEGAEHIAVVGQPVREADVIRYGIKVDGVEIGAPVEAPRVVGDGYARARGDRIISNYVHEGLHITDTDRVLDRQNYLSTPPRVSVEGDTITATVECDGYVLTASLSAPEGTGGANHNADALRRLRDAVGAVWREHTRAVG